MFSGVAMKSRTFSSFLHSINEQVWESWEGAQPGRQHKLAGGNIPYRGRHAPFVNGGVGWGGRNPVSLHSIFSMSLKPLFWVKTHS